MFKKLILLLLMSVPSFVVFAQNETSFVGTDCYPFRKCESGIALRSNDRPLTLQEANQLLGNNYSLYMTHIERWKKGQKMVVCGSVMFGIGVVSIPVGAILLGNFYDIGGIVTIITGGSLMLAGAPVLSVGIVRMTTGRYRANKMLKNNPTANEPYRNYEKLPLELGLGFSEKGAGLRLNF